MWFNKPIAAVDIGSRTIKGLKLFKRKGRIGIDSFFFYDLSSGNDLFPLEANSAEALNALIDGKGLKKAIASTSIQDGDVIIHDVVLPKMPAEDLKRAITNDLETHLDVNRDEICFDYVIADGADAEPEMQTVKVYCANKNAVTALIKTLAGSGLEARFIESGVLARVAMLAFNEYLEEDKSYVLTDLGESHTSVSLVTNGRVQFSSTIPTGLGAINQMLFDAYGIPYQESEKIKIAYDLVSEDINHGEIDHEQIDQIFHDLFYKIVRMVDLFKVNSKDLDIHSMLVTGGGSQLSQLEKALSPYCGLPVTIVNPFRKLEIFDHAEVDSESLIRLAPHMATAVGLALRGVA